MASWASVARAAASHPVTTSTTSSTSTSSTSSSTSSSSTSTSTTSTSSTSSTSSSTSSSSSSSAPTPAHSSSASAPSSAPSRVSLAAGSTVMHGDIQTRKHVPLPAHLQPQRQGKNQLQQQEEAGGKGEGGVEEGEGGVEEAHPLSTPSTLALVVDTGGLIRGGTGSGGWLARQATEFWTTPHVLEEARDKRTRHFVESFPFALRIREPPPQAVHAVTQFARKTGDLGALSPVDVGVLALAYALECEYEGKDRFLREEPLPPSNVQVVRAGGRSGTGGSGGLSATSTATGGSGDTSTLFFATASKENKALKQEQKQKQKEKQKQKQTQKQKLHPEDKDNRITAGNSKNDSKDGRQNGPESSETDESEDDDSEDGSADDSETGWITQDNVKDVTAALTGHFRATEEEVQARKVGCITTDYSMQNVLLQMGLHLVTVEGMHIRQVKQWVLQCFGCQNITREVERKFCPKCGHDTIQRVAMHVGSDGRVVYEHNPRRKISTRGIRYSIPKAKGGRVNNDLVLAEDVYLHKTRYDRRRDPWEFAPDAVRGARSGGGAAASGFGSGIEVGFGRKNPNVSRRKIGKKNKTGMGV